MKRLEKFKKKHENFKNTFLNTISSVCKLERMEVYVLYIIKKSLIMSDPVNG